MQKELRMRNNRVQEVIPEVTAISASDKQFMARASKWFDYLFVLRPTLFIPVWTVYGAGLHLARKGVGDAAIAIEWQFVIIAALTFLMGSAYILNQIVDIESDRLNNKLFLIADGHIPVAIAYLETLLLCVMPLVVATMHSVQMLVLFIVIYLVTGIFYSVPRFRWKDKPWLGIMANALGAYLILAVGWWAVGGISWRPFVVATPYAAAVAAVYVFTTIVDFEGDAKCDKITFAVKYGLKKTIWAGAFLEFVALASATIFQDFLILIPAALSLPFYVHAAIVQDKKSVVRAIKFPIVFLSIAVCYYFPMYFLLLATTFYMSKWYYHYRFGLKYPSLEAK